MRRLFMIGLATLFFSGCMMDVTAPVEQASPDHQVEAAVLQTESMLEVPAYYGDYRPNPRISDDRRITRPGEVVRDSRGGLEVLKASGEQKQVSAGPAELTVRETKLLRYVPATGRFNGGQTFEFVKLFVEVRNTGGEPIQFNPVSVIGTDTGEALRWEDDLYREELGGMIAPGEVKAGNIGFILRESDVDELTISADDIEFKIQF
ncbi:hypothetical protein SAMN04488127_1752 [Bhargavaea ginsengi]|uniref:DUF4352 domain-containing protein n=1 Tax=Bhargavaea ginsengi TaxID=426757 RepID=A0A1H6YQ22_9BACL|nr:DUF4352 domain-containing protein [Bhargavaea ginsengi]SEJ43381.1 hypothetical protein SAMN04488127_1752 [Bhargavaea ginsengi]